MSPFQIVLAICGVVCESWTYQTLSDMKDVVIARIFCSNYPYIGKVNDIRKVAVAYEFSSIHQKTQLQTQ
jgi:hypothetical protein